MIPNLKSVDEDKAIWRGGQPVTADDWQLLKSKGVTSVIKLNSDGGPTDLGAMPDDGALDIGLSLYKVPMGLLTQIVAPLKAAQDIEQAIWFIVPGTFIHCSHGQDRTGLAVAMWRHKVCGWSKEAAQAEMLANGFHEALLGLWVAWLAAQ